MTNNSKEMQFLAHKRRAEEIFALAKKGGLKSPVADLEMLKNYGTEVKEEVKDAKRRKN